MLFKSKWDLSKADLFYFEYLSARIHKSNIFFILFFGLMTVFVLYFKDLFILKYGLAYTIFLGCFCYIFCLLFVCMFIYEYDKLLKKFNVKFNWRD